MTTRVAIYARHSTDKQTTSTKDQIARCKEFCRQAGYEVTLTFCDEAISGASVVNRPGVSEMIDAALCGYFDRIVSEDLSRISRDQGDMAHFFRKFRFMDISIETVAEGEINELHIGLKGTMNALYIKDLADKTRRGQIASVLKGSIPGGKTYGYNLIKRYDEHGEPIRGLREINPEQADTIRWIFEQYDKGATLKHICDILNMQNIPSQQGGKWATTTLIGQVDRKSGLLRQTLYKGVLTFNRMMYRKNPDTGKRQSFIRPESEWIQVPAPELAIVDEALFDRVQEKIEERSSLYRQRVLLNKVIEPEKKPKRLNKKAYMKDYKRKRRATHALGMRYIFSGKLWCTVHQTRIKILRRHIYRCETKKCEQRTMKHENLMAAALEQIRNLDASQLINAINVHRKEKEQMQAFIADEEKRITATRDEIRVILSGMTRRPDKATETMSYIQEKETEIQKLQYELELHRKKLAPIDDIDQAGAEALVKKYLSAIEPLYKDPNDQVVTATVRNWFARFNVSSRRISEKKIAREYSVTVEFDWLNLLTDLRASPLAPAGFKAAQVSSSQAATQQLPS